MGLLSILPDQFISVETWLTRFFLLVGTILIGPWVCLLVYDLVLYIARSITHEIPFVGGRAQGKNRPRLPSLTERPSGHRRRFSLTPRRPPRVAHGSMDPKLDPMDTRWRKIREETDGDAAAQASVFEQ